MTPDQTQFVVDRAFTMSEVFDLNGVSYRGVPCQVACPIHKVGRETRLSARLYSDGLWCFTCSRQYRPSEIHAAFRGIDREKAVQELYTKKIISVSFTNEILKEYYTPRKKPVPVALINRANTVLLQYRHKVPLVIYREWAKRLLQLKQIMAETPEDYQAGKLHAFLQQMESEFTGVT